MHKKVRYLLCLSTFLTACSSGASISALDITIKDLTAPTITIKKKTYSITEGDSFKIQDCYSVFDNLTEKPTVDIDEGGFSNKKAGTYTIKITATDESGNTAEDSFKVEVKEKPKPTPTPTPTPTLKETPEAKENSNTQSNANSDSSYSQSNNSSSSQNNASSESRQSYFPFLEGEHDGGEAAIGRCLAAGWSSCGPVDSDGDGVYDGIGGKSTTPT